VTGRRSVDREHAGMAIGKTKGSCLIKVYLVIHKTPVG